MTKMTGKITKLICNRCGAPPFVLRRASSFDFDVAFHDFYTGRLAGPASPPGRPRSVPAKVQVRARAESSSPIILRAKGNLVTGISPGSYRGIVTG